MIDAGTIGAPAGPASFPPDWNPHLLDSFCRRMAKKLRADASAVRLLVGNELVLAGSFGIPPDQLPPSMPRDYGLANTILSLERPLVVADVRAYPATRRIATPHDSYRFQFISFAGVPIIKDNRPAGVIGVYTAENVRLFKDGDVDLLMDAGAELALEI